MHFIHKCTDRMFRLALPLAIALSLTTAALAPAKAGIPVGGADMLEQAQKGFLSRLDAAKDKKMLPRLSDPQDAVALEALWNLPAIIGDTPYKAADLPILMDIIQQQAQITKAYIFYSPDPSREPDTEANSTAFQDEITRASVAMLGLITAALEAADDTSKTLKTDGSDSATAVDLIKLRSRLQQVITGTALMLRNPGLKPDNQIRITTALADYAPVIAQTTSLQERQALTAVISDLKPLLITAAQSAADRFTTLLDSTDCNGLCALR